ncbi:metalloprotease [Entomophthora muscae]|uniref:Metalloprotease n=1 Tax=Entomophthora muscae TaxID=34485 RepID=A0ACC2RIZ3_9FUNG|nr:metalloprotease [Entomophthora muscae]
MDLMAGIVKMQLKTFVYNPQLAGLTYNIVSTADGLVLVFSGYSQKIEKFTLKVLNLIKNVEISESSFKVYKDIYIQDNINAQFDAPYKHAMQRINVALVENAWAKETLLSSLAPISHVQLSKFTKHLLSSAKMEMLVIGNIDQGSARCIIRASQDLLQLKLPSNVFLHPTRSVVLPRGNFVTQMILKTKEEVNSAIVFYLETYAYHDLIARVSTRLLAQMPFRFAKNQLHAQEQLGYSVEAEKIEMKSRGGLIIIIQSERHPVYLESRIETMLESFYQLVKAMSREEFRQYKNTIKSSVLEKQRNLQETTDFYWKTIRSGFYDFSQVIKIVSIY